MNRLLILLLSGMMTLMASAYDFAGVWHGSLSLGADSIPLVIRIIESDGAPKAVLDSPAQGAKDIPADITISDDTLQVNVPVMALNGTLDMQVDADLNLKAISDGLPVNPANVIKAYPGLNHMMQHASTGAPNEYGLIEETMSEEVLRDITKWIKSLKK